MAGEDDKQLKDFQGLPIASLIGDPLIQSARSQAKLAGVTLDFCNQFGFMPDPDDPKKTITKTVDVEVEQLVKGQLKPIKRTVKMPLLSMVTIPNLSIDDVKVHYWQDGDRFYLMTMYFDDLCGVFEKLVEGVE